MDPTPAAAIDAREERGGSHHDKQDMARMGKEQRLERSFKSVAILGLTSLLLGTWPTILSTSTFSLINGGRAGSVWTFGICWIMEFFVILSMAEMQSMAPTSGGQYHWVSEFASPTYQKLLSYTTGWLAALGWQAFIASPAFATAQMILICISIDDPSYITPAWQGSLLTIAIAFAAAGFHLILARRLPTFEGLVLVLYLVGFFAILIPLWVLAPKVGLATVLTTFDNYGGWPTIEAACLVGSLAASSALIGMDSAVHMSEEVKNASLSVPRTMVASFVLSGLMGLAMLTMYVSCIQDIEVQIVSSTAIYPWIDVFSVSLGSKGGTLAITSLMIILGFITTINACAAASRQCWSFARDRGLPFSAWIVKLRDIHGTPQPVNAMLASMPVCAALALLNLGGSEVFNSIIGLLNGAVGLTYALSLACVLSRRSSKIPLPRARWSLGRSGTPINIIALLWKLLTVVVSFFPVSSTFTPKTMNWGFGMFAVAAILCVSSYILIGHKSYKGPVRDFEQEHEAHDLDTRK